MHEIIIETQPFIEKFTQKEIKQFTKNKIKKTNPEEFEIKFKTNEELSEFLTNILYYSRTIENIYLKQDNNKTLLFQTSLSQRDYKINQNPKTDISPLITNYLLLLLEIDKNKKPYSIINPLENLGETIIETAVFHPRQPLNIQKRLKQPYLKLLNTIPKIPKQEENKNKYIAIVQDNKTFKKLKENTNFHNLKIKMSQYEMDWLDVKYKKAEIDYAVTYIPETEKEQFEEMQNQFFYQTEFICKKKIGLITKKPINKKFLKKYKLKITHEETINYNNEKYYIYIIQK